MSHWQNDVAVERGFKSCEFSAGTELLVNLGYIID